MNDILNVKSLNEVEIQSRIYEVRGVKVMIDSDLAIIYGTTTGQLKRQVRRNIIRFPDDFMFQLTLEEAKSLRCQNGILNKGRGNHDKYAPFAFTELGVAMLSSVLTSDVAALANINIMRAFVALRKQVASKESSQLRIDKIENQLMMTNQYIEEILRDQNDTNEEVQAQLDAISQSLNELQMKVEMKPSKRAIVKGFSSENNNK